MARLTPVCSWCFTCGVVAFVSGMFCAMDLEEVTATGLSFACAAVKGRDDCKFIVGSRFSMPSEAPPAGSSRTASSELFGPSAILRSCLSTGSLFFASGAGFLSHPFSFPGLARLFRISPPRSSDRGTTLDEEAATALRPTDQ